MLFRFVSYGPLRRICRSKSEKHKRDTKHIKDLLASAGISHTVNVDANLFMISLDIYVHVFCSILYQQSMLNGLKCF